jgi:hypothetical protein
VRVGLLVAMLPLSALIRIAHGSGAPSDSPAAPANVLLTQGPSPSTSTQSLTWTASSGATSYNIYRNGSPYATGVACCSFRDTAATASNFINTWAVENIYSYTVSAVNGGGESPQAQPRVYWYKNGIDLANINYGVCGNAYSFPDPTASFNATTVAGSKIITISQTSPTASFTGSVSGTSLTVSGVTGTILPGQYLNGPKVPLQTIIVSGSGSNWTLKRSVGTIEPEAMTSGSEIFILPYTMFSGRMGPNGNNAPIGGGFSVSNYGATIQPYGTSGTTGAGTTGTYALNSTAKNTVSTPTAAATWITNCVDNTNPEPPATFDLALASEGGVTWFSNPPLAPQYDLNIGAFTYLTMDVYLFDANESANYTLLTRPGGTSPNAGDIFSNITLTLFNGTSSAYGTPTIGGWATLKVPLSALGVGTARFSGYNTVKWEGKGTATGGTFTATSTVAGGTSNIQVGDIMMAQGYDYAWQVVSGSGTTWTVQGACNEGPPNISTATMMYDVPVTLTTSIIGPLDNASFVSGAGIPNGTMLCGSGTSWWMANGVGSTIPQVGSSGSPVPFNTQRISFYKAAVKVGSTSQWGAVLFDNFGVTN